MHDRSPAAHLSSHECFEGDACYEVGPDDVQHLQHQQQDVKEPPRGVRPDDLPALEHCTIQDPTSHTHAQTETYTLLTLIRQ